MGSERLGQFCVTCSVNKAPTDLDTAARPDFRGGSRVRLPKYNLACLLSDFTGNILHHLFAETMNGARVGAHEYPTVSHSKAKRVIRQTVHGD